jgi:hypothetical protein
VSNKEGVHAKRTFTRGRMLLSAAVNGGRVIHPNPK